MKISSLVVRRALSTTTSAPLRPSSLQSGTFGFNTSASNNSNDSSSQDGIVEMFKNPSLKTRSGDPPSRLAKMNRKNPSARDLDERFLKILKIFKWGPDAEKAIEVLLLKVDHRLVREVLKLDVEIGVKLQFFKWAAKKKKFQA